MIPEWAFKLFGWLFKSNKIEEFKALTSGYKEIYTEYRIKIEEQQKRIKELEEMKGNLKSQDERETMLDDQQSFHADYIRLLEEHRDALEELYFLRYEIKRFKQ